MKVQVLQEDIDKGIKANGFKCPVALALKRATGDAWAVAHLVVWREDGESSVYTLPESAVEWVRRFDHSETVAPCTFRIRKYRRGG